MPSAPARRPLFDADELAPLRAARNAVARDLEHPEDTVFPFSRACGVAGAADLAGGRAGLAVLFAHLGRPETAVRHLNAALAAAAAAPFALRFLSGTCGTAWAATHVAHLLVGPDTDDPVADVDDAVLALLDGGGGRPAYDLTSGLVGLGAYALERLPRPRAAALLDRIVAELAARAVGDDRMATWRTTPGGHHDLGMAHGVPGVVALLAGAHAAGRPGARPLLDRAVAWLGAQAPLPGPGARFPKWRDRAGSDGAPARQGWCYGAPGLAAALLGAAQATGEASWRDAAVDLAVRAAATSADACRIVDAGLCHGAAGVAHLHHRMYRTTGHPALRDAARAWFGRLLALRVEGAGIGGFRAYFPRAGHEDPWVADGGLLTGAAGVALALHAAVDAAEPGWDRMLLVSGPPVVACSQPARARAPARAASER